MHGFYSPKSDQTPAAKLIEFLTLPGFLSQAGQTFESDSRLFESDSRLLEPDSSTVESNSISGRPPRAD